MRHICFACTTFVVLAVGSNLAADAPKDALRTISVSGRGTATSPPDMATVHTGVETYAPTAGDALEANSTAVRRLMGVLKDSRIADKDIQTSNFNIRPEYRRDQRGMQQPEIAGYRVSNQVTVRVRKLSDLGRILDDLVQAGSNQISGITFGIDDDTGVMNQARNRAIRDARSRADLYAQAAGVKVGRVISISEQGSAIPSPQPMFRAMAVAESSVPVASGEQEVAAVVHLVFQLEDRD